MIYCKWIFVVACLTMSPVLIADDGFLSLVENSEVLDQMAPEVRLLITMTVLSMIPALLIAVTAFTRIVIVLSLLRQALGLMQTPPNVVIITLSIFLTWFVMQPVFEQVDKAAVTPYLSGQKSLSQAVDDGIKPFRAFMIEQTKEEDFAAVLEMAQAEVPSAAEDVLIEHLIPAFLLSELKTAFQIAFMIFIPFLLIDLVVASVLMALGMIMVPPISIALPIKIMLFVLIDGWTLVTQSLVGSFLT
ncbi:flagellar type III secretion system pore protein FliP [Agaribacter marinus]|uniref:Flagellar biosynthetic protein FliP n=1 Tax=Agaribacter marinus TaxID=1431249 RepID=A0AA37WJB4_9ALTE|nr:flagellar type III secretion system pore protein FliP [Agaribacter marinus]GLR70024.1 hypothetical protein GCM10007852_09320 [Agaribacter marinus]